MKILHNKWWLALLSLFLLANCTPSNEDGSALIGVSTQALSASDVTKVTITISGPNISPNIVQDLVKTGSQWKGIIGKIPVGTNRTFTAEAFDSGNNKIYAGSAIHTISKGAPAIVNILLQQVTPPNPFQNTVPDITALTASAAQVGNDETINFTVTANDADGDALTYNWTASTGTFTAGANSTNATWQAPAASFTGNVTISVEVTDGAKGGKTGTSVVIEVQPHFSTGKAKVSVEFNTWPDVNQVTSTKGRVNVGESTNLAAFAVDNDGDTLSYAWSDGPGSDCQAGMFSNDAAAIPTATWTAPAVAPASGECTLTVTVTDGRGGTNTGSVTIKIAAPQAANIAPKLTTTFQSTDEAKTGDSVTFRVVAKDPENTALTFAWSDASGTISSGITNTNTGSEYTSELVWTRPASGACTQTVTAVVTDADGQSTTHAFIINCPGWATSAGGSGSDLAYRISLAGNGDVYLVGNHTGSVTFPTTPPTTLTSSSGRDGYVAKIDKDGNWKWVIQASSAGGDVWIRGVSHNNNGRVFVTGYNVGGLTLRQQTGSSVSGINGSTPLNGASDVFVARIDENGTTAEWKWLLSAGGPSTDIAIDIACDQANGDVFVAGSYAHGPTFGSITPTSAGGQPNAFVAKVVNTGTLSPTWSWVNWVDGLGISHASQIALSAGSIFFTGTFSGVNNFPTAPVTSYNQNNSSSFIARLAATSGGMIWAKQMTTSGNLNARAIAADGSGNSFVTGSFDGSASFGNSVTLNSTSGSADVFVAKYDINGVAQWATNSGGSSDEGATGIALNGTGNIYITGGFRGNTSFGTTTLTSAGDLDVFVARLDSTGTFRWATRGGGGSGDTGHSIQVDSTGAITVSGWFGFVTSTFGATSLNNSGSDDIVVWRLFE